MHPSRRARTPARRARAAGALATALLLAGGAGWRLSGAGYTSTTVDGPDSFASGSVALSDDDAGSALVSASGLRPGSTGQQCLLVTYAGTLAATVRVYASALATTNALSSHLDVQIEEGSSPTTFPSCTGFVATAAPPLYHGTWAALPTTWAAGVGAWAATGTTSRAYRITWTLSSTAPTTTQGGTASATLTWEAQNA